MRKARRLHRKWLSGSTAGLGAKTRIEGSISADQAAPRPALYRDPRTLADELCICFGACDLLPTSPRPREAETGESTRPNRIAIYVSVLRERITLPNCMYIHRAIAITPRLSAQLYLLRGLLFSRAIRYSVAQKINTERPLKLARVYFNNASTGITFD